MNTSYFPDIPQMPTDFPSKQKLEIGRIEYEAPNFISNGATQYDLAKALEQGFQDLSIRNEVKYPELMAPEMEITVPTMTVKSQATDVETLARDTVAAVKQELIKSANLFAQLHITNHAKTGEWPEWYQQRYDAVLRELICWEGEWVEKVDPFAGFPAELSREDKCGLLLGHILAVAGKAEELEVLWEKKGWGEEFMAKLLSNMGPHEEVNQKDSINVSPKHIESYEPQKAVEDKFYKDYHEETNRMVIGDPIGNEADRLSRISRFNIPFDLEGEVEEIINLSPTLKQQLDSSRKTAVIYGLPGGGTAFDHDNNIIIIDSNEQAKPLLLVRSLAHEMGHKNHPPDDRTSLDEWMASEGAAQLNSMIVREEILANGGPDIGIAGGSPYEEDYMILYRAYKNGILDYEQTIRKIGKIYEKEPPSSGKHATYRELYTSKGAK